MIKLIRKLLRLNKVPKRASRKELVNVMFKFKTAHIPETLGIHFMQDVFWLPPPPSKSDEEVKRELNLRLVNYTEVFLEVDYMRLSYDKAIAHPYEKGTFLISDHLLLQETSGIVRGRV